MTLTEKIKAKYLGGQNARLLQTKEHKKTRTKKGGKKKV